VNIIIWQGVDGNVLTLADDPTPLDQAAFVRLLAYYMDYFARLRSDREPRPRGEGDSEDGRGERGEQARKHSSSRSGREVWGTEWCASNPIGRSRGAQPPGEPVAGSQSL
jgi:hypothetical protein